MNRFRLAAEADTGAVVALMRRYYEEDGYPFVEAEARGAVLRLLRERSLGRLWVAQDEGRVAGYLALTLGFSLEFRGRDAFIDELYISEESRGKGLGREALELAETCCRELGVKALHLEVERHREPALELYKRAGFADHDRRLMTKWITGPVVVEIRREDLLSAVAQSLIADLNAELSATYPEQGATHFRLDPGEVAEGRGAFFVAYVNGEPAGCGAVRLIDEGTAEIKRMYAASSQRGRGIGRAVLNTLEEESRRLGAGRVVLETGVRQTRALALYATAGFEHIPPYGEYVGSPLSFCMAKDLSR